MSAGVVGLILAGGLGRRMGGIDKAAVILAGATLMERVARRLAPQCDGLVINASGDPARFAALGHPVVPDDLPGHLGPLAGLVAGLDWIAAHRPSTALVASVAVDTPFLPRDLVDGLWRARAAAGADLACAASCGRRHPVVALWPTGLRHRLREIVAGPGTRSVGAVLSAGSLVEAQWPAVPFDPFLNINRPEDLEAAERILGLDPDA